MPCALPSVPIALLPAVAFVQGSGLHARVAARPAAWDTLSPRPWPETRDCSRCCVPGVRHHTSRYQCAHPQGPLPSPGASGALLPARLWGVRALPSPFSKPGKLQQQPRAGGASSHKDPAGQPAPEGCGAGDAELSRVWFPPGDRSPLLASSPTVLPRESRGLRGPQHPQPGQLSLGDQKDEPSGADQV